MAFLKNISSGAVSANMSTDSDIYSVLSALRDSTTGKPAYEDVSSGQASAATARFVAAVLPAAAAAVAHDALISSGLAEDATVSLVTYTPNANITGQATNFRTIAVVADPDNAAPISVASLPFSSGAVTATAGTPKTITAGTSAVPGGSPLLARSSVTGTGLADPGGLVVVTYT